jgi:voltage-gated sodium channel
MQIFVDNMVGRNTRYGGLSLKREAESAIIPGLSREEKKEEALKRENSKRLFSMYERNRKKFERRKQRAEIKRCHEYYTRFAKEVHHFAHGRIFSMFILLSIVFSAVIVGIRTNEEYIAKHEETYDIFDGIIVGIFTLEVAFGIIGFAWEPWRFFFEPLGGCYTLHRSDTGQRTKDAKGRKGRWSCCMKVRFWNVFNFITTGISYIPGDGKLGMMFRLLRMLRVLKVLSFLKQLQIILTGLIEGLKSMFWVSVIEFLFFYIYAILGMSLFGRNDPLHFGNLGDTFITLFRCATMEDWTEIMYNNMYGCDIFGYENDYSGDWNWMCSEPRARPYQSALYFISFEVVSALIILNLVIGKISFSMMQAQVSSRAQTVHSAASPRLCGLTAVGGAGRRELPAAIRRSLRPLPDGVQRSGVARQRVAARRNVGG